MPNSNKNKANQPPTGEGKKQSTQSSAANKLNKRSEGVQAQRGHAEENIGTDADEDAARSQGLGETERDSRNPKAGR